MAFIDTGVSSVASANVLTVRTFKMAANSVVVGMIVVSSNDSAMLSKQPVFEGDYEYTKWDSQFVESLLLPIKESRTSSERASAIEVPGAGAG